MKKFKRVAALALAVLMAQSAVSVATVSASAAVVSNVAVSAGELLDSGTCGDDVTWSLYKNGLLSIVGTGRMENYSTENKAPWYESRTRIQDIAISNGVTEIGSCAFRNCNYAVSASIPSTVTSIGDSAFLGCSLLDNVSISGNVTDIGANAFSDCKNLTKFVFPKGLETIGDTAFANTGLKMVSFSDTVTTIGKNVFVNCTKLSVAFIPSNVTEIGHTVFGANAENFAVYGYSESYAESYCQQNNLRFVALDEFYDCGTCGESILWMLDNDGVMYIRGTGDMNNYIKAAAQPWYDYKTKINSIVIEEGVNSIGDFAFYGCKYATDVTVPDTINSIGKNAFYSCISLKNIELPASVEYINAYAFYKCTSLQAITIPSGIKDIGNYAFSNCTILKTVNFDKGVEVLTGTYIFNKCTSLEEISLPKTLTSVPKNMFANCSALQKVTIPAPVVLISTGVFNYTSSNLVICGYEGTFAEEYADGNDYEFSPLRPKADGECGENLKWVLDEDNDLTIYGSGDMYDYTDVRVPWSEYSSEISEVIIASGVTSIGSNAFEEFSNINKVIIPDTITKIGDSAFTGCSNITEFRFPKNLTSIGNSAFERCDLSVVTLPETVVSIGNKAFRNNHNLIKAEIPRNIEVVGTLAFDGDSEDLTIYGYTNSPAQKYALSEDIKFESIGVIPIIEPTEPATSATTSTDSTDSTSSTDATEYTEAPTSYTVYYDNSSTLWSDVYVYYWNENDESVAKVWPGIKMNDIGNQVYKAVIPANITNVAFNNNKGSQTLDLSSPNGNKIFKDGGWQNYVPPTEPVTTVPETTKNTSETTPATTSSTGREDVNSIMIFYDNSSTKWNGVNVHYWNNDGTANTTWPGESMRKYLGDIYYAIIPIGATNVLFNNPNNNEDKTGDLKVAGNNKIYVNGEWKECTITPTTATTATIATTETTATQVPTVPLSDYLVFYHNEKNFSSPYVYYWSDSNKQMVSWPGIPMTHYVGDVYYAQLPQDAKYVIFSDNGGNKTGDLTMQSFGMIYGNGKWSDYYNPSTIPPTTVTQPTTVTSPITEPITQADTTIEHTTAQTIESVLIGDANLSNKITVGDVTEIQQYLVQLVSLSGKAMFAAETDNDGRVNIKDATNIQKYLLDFNNCGNVGKRISCGAEPETTPVTTKPTTAPVPTTTKPIPTTTAPVPTTTKPIPTTTAPVPTTTAPVPTTTAPTVPTTVKTTGMIYYKNVNNWSSVSAYYWSDTNKNMLVWPGNTMKNEGNGIYSIEVPLNATYIIFNNSNNGSKTDDLTISGFDMIYENGVWKIYQKEQTTTQSVTQPVTQPITTQPTTEPQPEVSHKIYYENTSNWGGVRAYYWSDTNKSMVSWPGVTMTKVKGSIYGVEIPDDAQYVIFNNGASNQTDDITIPARGMLYSGGKWVNYTEPYAAKTVIYLKDSGGSNGKLNWNTPYVYYWSIADSKMTDFPGLAMTKVSTDLWKAEIPVAAECLIFSNAGSDQSPPIIFYYENHTNMYDYGNAVWTNYNG